MYHELGHVFAAAYGIGRPNLWFGEFMAGYFAEAYRADAPDESRLQVFSDLLSEWLARGSKPVYTSLDDLERLYASMPASNYGWYQAQFEKRGKDVYREQGFSFIQRVRAALPASEGRALTVTEVLARLEKISPGFEAWARSLGHR
jgi:hypothetical protein